MKSCADFLAERFKSGGFTAEDTLASFLPLLRQVAQAHAQQMVAPLEGLDGLFVEGVQIWFEQSRLVKPKHSRLAVAKLDRPQRGSMQVVDELTRTTDVAEGRQTISHLNIASRDDAISGKVYLPGHVSWEHMLGCHDPLSDVFSLGMLLASMACRLDLNDPDDLRTFVTNRGNLFAVNQHLHPVLAKAISRMTELSRHDRLQDLDALLGTLENYRDRETDIDFDLFRIEGYETKPLRDKQQIILSRLQERLFEISRRNRLLHFRPTMQTINLTHASVPLAFDVKSIRRDQILTWSGAFKADIQAQRELSLNKYLNFREALYLPSQLDRIRTEARRDQAEFGFAQLRLVICMLRWTDLKDPEQPRCTSPLVLLPVELVKKKGVRDTYRLKPLDSEAQINPVLRHRFKQLFDIDLPESIDLAKVDLGDLHRMLADQIHATEPAVMLEKIERPKIELIHDLARRRLDQYTRRVRLAGRTIRSFMDLDYSYDPANFHPLGVRIFNQMIRPAETHLQRIIAATPRPRRFVTPAPGGASGGAPGSDPPVAQKQGRFFTLLEDSTNPYQWQFDLCSVTLGNFKYRKMSLVRDYTALLAEPRQNAAFEATFSLVARPVDEPEQQSLDLDDRYHVLPCDPTQTSAIALARSQCSYIIQGPPGTGKSQTIANLIADYIMRGKRVLFVCEKRAAIDVVYRRLEAQGLGDLACLIHDSQADKKAFVMDLKRTYESFQDTRKQPANRHRRARKTAIAAIKKALEPLEQFNQAMLSAPPWAGMALHKLIRRAIELADQNIALSALELERFPDYGLWVQQRDRIARLIDTLREIQPDGVLANHPLALLSARLAKVDQPLNLVTEQLNRARPLLKSIGQVVRDHDIDPATLDSIDSLEQLIAHAVALQDLARWRLLGLLDKHSDVSNRFDRLLRAYKKERQALDTARTATRAWKMKLPQEEAQLALAQAGALQGSFFAFCKPAWWRLRRILNQCYEFKLHVVKPTWTHILERLCEEYRIKAVLQQQSDDARQDYGFEPDLDEFVRQLEVVKTLRQDVSDQVRTFSTTWLKSQTGYEAVTALAALAEDLQLIHRALDTILEDYRDLSPAQLETALEGIDAALDELPDFLYCLAELAQLPHDLAAVFRRQKLSPAQIEAAMIQHSLDRAWRSDRGLSRFNAVVRSRSLDRLGKHYDQWEQLNAATVRESVCQRFLEHLKLSSLPAAQLSDEQKELKKRYNRGRRELEHEFGKTMRYKPIRDMAAGDSGLVVKDLKPVWLMSPLSVSDTLPLDPDHFDVVIFDEASQITLEEAIPSIFRARQAIVLGDEMQLPPTNFFSAKRSDDEESLTIEHEGQTLEYDLSTSSFLNHAARNLPARMLGWHYRSRSEALISFSNWAFYQGRLMTVPDERIGSSEQPPINAATPQEGEENAARILERPVSFHFMSSGLYQKRRNRVEADYIAQLVRSLLEHACGKSIGIVAFSETQQDEIESALQRLADDDLEFRRRLDAELEREQDGQFVGLLVKNLENIQGDERDIVIMSVCYGYTSEGNMRMNFGPINQSGGEKRLNVAFSRAKHFMVLVSSIRHADIKNDYNVGANCLKNYLRYAEACSINDKQTARRVLEDLAAWHDSGDAPEAEHLDVVVSQIAETFGARGYKVTAGVGQSEFRCDLALWREGDTVYRLGILVDTDSYYERFDLIERDLMKPALLRAFGWRIVHVQAKDWLLDRDKVIARIDRALQGSVAEEDEQAEVLRDDADDAADSSPASSPHAPSASDPPARG